MTDEEICKLLNNSVNILSSFADGRSIASLAGQFKCDSLIIEAVIRSAHNVMYQYTIKPQEEEL